MSTIPPNWMASVIGTQGTQHSAGAAKNKEAADQADRAKFAEKLQDVIENTDRDGAVYEDAEGLGSQGRSSSEQSEEQEGQDAEQSGPPPGGLDVQA